ncbi:hypothetical protein KIM372_04000 [Bombiscardovia nodaiensis]|uniref:SdpI/YhfL protein family n=1 Tax=Bombiscardovia nodaiensis TaxID=2932181 RepID=A0ABM8B6M6_9BIFI|nr:hypothetical protein KIM372_04000 [Bombiscardovia nodaiensis]
MIFLVMVVVMGAATVLFAWVYALSKSGKLRRTSFASGVNVDEMLASDETWNYVYRKYAPSFLADAVLCGLTILVTALGCVLAGSWNNMGTWAFVLVMVLVLAALISLIVTGVKAGRDAKTYNRDHHITSDHKY